MKRILFGSSLVVVGLVSLISAALVTAAPPPSGDFSIEVSPSIISAEVTPGQQSTIELKVRNASTKAEDLKMELQSFTFNSDTQSVDLNAEPLTEISQWVHFSQPSFRVEPGQWFTQKITVNLPDSAAFNYPFAIVISRQSDSQAQSGSNLKGSVAVFSLINVNRPGSLRQLQLTDLKTSQLIYEYLPADLRISLKNSGNSIVRPYGNVYIQRSSSDTDPIATLPVNNGGVFILPDTTRQLNVSWNDGFPTFVKDDDGSSSVSWEKSDTAKFRFGKYTAKVIAVYNDGERDIPLIGETTFWVIPWRALGVLLLIIGLVLFAVWTIVRRALTSARKLRRKSPKSPVG